MSEVRAGEERYWYLRTEEEALMELESRHDGLSHHEAARRLASDGPNSIAREDALRWLKILWRQANSLLIYLLLGTATVSLLTDHPVEFWVIIAIVLATVLLGFFQAYHAERSIASLGKLVPRSVTVIRDGKRHELPTERLVRGDIVVLTRGMIVPADLRVIESKGLAADESILTGESVTKPKHAKRMDTHAAITEQANILFGGTSVTNGNGLGLVVETGLSSELGRISLLLKRIGDEPSPLQRQIDTMGRRISLGVLIICGFLFAILLLKGEPFYSLIILCAAVAVSGIPESFPLAITFALSNGLRRMAKKNALVKDLNSVETLGTCTVICTDKTGTLTESRMRVTNLHLPDGRDLTVEGKGYEPTGKILHGSSAASLAGHDRLFRACILCNNAELLFDEGEWVIKGEPTEGALLVLARIAGEDDAVLREDNPRVDEVPFDPAHKYMITVNKGADGKLTAHLKGAVERVLERCAHYRHGAHEKALTKHDRERLLRAVHRHTAASLRVLGVATKCAKDAGDIDDGYVLEGILCLEDPIRAEAVEAVKECHAAGIKVIMVTGDHRVTADAVGKRLGLFQRKGDRILEGEQLELLSDHELDEAIPDIVVFARTTPDQKLRIVQSLQRRGEIVAMTGDGVNDAPALKKADIGIAMGRRGTDVARESANMVLLDDNFRSISEAVREGRTIYSNIRRFVYYLLTGNFTEVGLIIVAVLVGLSLPLTALMILFINLVTSTIPALALSVEPTHPKVMRQRPRSPKESILSAYILFKILVLIPVLLFGTLLLFFWELELRQRGLASAQTLAFVTLILFELFHAFNARSLHTTIFNASFFKNPFIFLAVLLSLLLTLLAALTPAGNALFKTVPLPSSEWFVSLAVASSIIVVAEAIKLLIKSEFKEQGALQGVQLRLE